MKTETSSSSFCRILYRALASNRAFRVLVPVIFLMIIVNSKLDIFTQKLFIDTMSIIDRKYSGEGEYSGLNEHFERCLKLLVLHYTLSQVIDYMENVFSLLVYKSFLRESVRRTTELEYCEFHSQGSAAIQETIIRSSKAARDSIPILLFELPKSMVTSAMAMAEIFDQLRFNYSVIFTCLILFSMLVAFFIAIYAYRKDRYNIFLFNKSLDPLSDILSNFDIMKAFNREEHEISTYDRALSPYTSTLKDYYLEKNSLLFVQKLALLLPQMFIIYSILGSGSIWNVLRERENLITIASYNALYVKIKTHILRFRNSIFLIVKKSAEVRTDLKFTKDSIRPGTVAPDFNHFIKLSNVDLYAGNNLIQKGQSFIINKNDRVAITGTNGAGKSVFLKTLLKFFKSEGSLCIDNTPIGEISDKSMRELISYVPQDPHIFNNTVLYNLAYSQQDIDVEEIYRLCEEYGVHEFFKDMKDGYHTMAGERGKYLSGGQKQRISFMRAIIKKAPIIVMDEPTANIDKASEASLINKIFTKTSSRTFILIVHNLDLLRKFDKILCFAREGIVSYDSYDSFINKSMN